MVGGGIEDKAGKLTLKIELLLGLRGFGAMARVGRQRNDNRSERGSVTV